MSAVVAIEIVGKPSDRLIAEVFHGPFAGRVAIAHLVGDEEAESRSLLDAEGWEPELYATTFAGAPITSIAAEASRARAIKAWCAVRAPFVIHGAPAIASYLRFGVPGAADEIDRYIPIALLVAGESRLTLTFAAGGAPFLPPVRVDDGGPIDQAWARSVEASRAWLAQAIAALGRDPALEVRVTGLGGS